jgi:hypothetical protein
MADELTKTEAIEYLGISDKEFDNYFQKSEELKGYKKGARWYFDKQQLESWNKLRKDRTVMLNLKEYESCFEFAIKMVYSSKAMGGSIRGARSEMQAADDWILGILAEHGLKKFLNKKFDFTIKLDTEVHPEYITPQDIEKVIINGKETAPKLNVGVKASKFKNCFLVLSELEHDSASRKSDVYVFVRVGLPSDHLFRILREHSFFKNVTEFLKEHKDFRQILKLEEIPIWICGFTYYEGLEKVKEIPGQKFEDGYRYTKSVAKMHNSDEDWKKLIDKL